MTSVGEDIEILEPSYTAGGMESGAVAVATSLVVLTVLNTELPRVPAIHTYTYTQGN